jgi:hypothetical protein
MKPEEIQEQIKSNSRIIHLKEQEIQKLRQTNKQLKIDKEMAVFELVLDFIEIGEKITFTKGYSNGGLANGDVVEVLKKNKKSVVVKYIKIGNGGRWKIEKEGDTKRIVSKVFGEWVFHKTDHVKKMIERNSVLKELLG